VDGDVKEAGTEERAVEKKRRRVRGICGEEHMLVYHTLVVDDRLQLLIQTADLILLFQDTFLLLADELAVLLQLLRLLHPLIIMSVRTRKTLRMAHTPLPCLHHFRMLHEHQSCLYPEKSH